MAYSTAIAWTDHTFNPWMGCFKVSQGCKNCYAETLTGTKMKLDVFGADTSKRKRTGKATWNKPRGWNNEAIYQRRAHRVFCASLADVFEDAPGPNEWRPELFQLIKDTPWLDWQLLTKRPENIAKMLPDTWGDNDFGFWPNVWLGTSIEDNRVKERSVQLTEVPAVVHFISYEPAIGPFDEVSLFDIEWLIVGGESGPGYRSMDLDWAREARRMAEATATAFFFKQNHGYRTELGIDALGEVVRKYPAAWERIGSVA